MATALVEEARPSQAAVFNSTFTSRSTSNATCFCAANEDLSLSALVRRALEREICLPDPTTPEGQSVT